MFSAKPFCSKSNENHKISLNSRSITQTKPTPGYKTPCTLLFIFIRSQIKQPIQQILEKNKKAEFKQRDRSKPDKNGRHHQVCCSASDVHGRHGSRASAGGPSPREVYKTCFAGCDNKCKGSGNGATFCEMKCDTDCAAKESAGKKYNFS